MLKVLQVHLLQAFFVARKCQKVQKIDENRREYRQRNSSLLLNDLSNLNEILRKDVLMIILKATKNRSSPSL